MSEQLRWKEIEKIEDVIDLKVKGTLLDFVILRSIVSIATIVYFSDRDVRRRVEPILKVENNAEYAGVHGVRVEQSIEKVRDYLSRVDWLLEVK